MLNTIGKLWVLSVNTVEDVKDGLLYVQFLSLDTTAISQIGPFLVAARTLYFPKAKTFYITPISLKKPTKIPKKGENSQKKPAIK